MLAAGKERDDKGSARECEGSERVDPLLESRVRPRTVITCLAFMHCVVSWHRRHVQHPIG